MGAWSTDGAFRRGKTASRGSSSRRTQQGPAGTGYTTSARPSPSKLLHSDRNVGTETRAARLVIEELQSRTQILLGEGVLRGPAAGMVTGGGLMLKFCTDSLSRPRGSTHAGKHTRHPEEAPTAQGQTRELCELRSATLASRARDRTRITSLHQSILLLPARRRLLSGQRMDNVGAMRSIHQPKKPGRWTGRQETSMRRIEADTLQPACRYLPWSFRATARLIWPHPLR